MTSKEMNNDLIKVILDIPKDTVKITLTATVLSGDEFVTAQSVLTPSELMQMRQDYLYLDPTDDAFAVYALTENGLKYAEGLKE